MSWFNMKCNMKSAEEADRNAKRVNELNVELTEATNELIKLRNQLADRDSAEAAASVEFDFNAVKVFCVERNTDEKGRPVTIVGFLLPTEVLENGVVTNKDTAKEWHLYCNQQRHEELVVQFQRFKRGVNK